MLNGGVLIDGGRSFSADSMSMQGSGKTDTLIVEVMVGDELAERIYVTGKELSSQRRTD